MQRSALPHTVDLQIVHQLTWIPKPTNVAVDAEVSPEGAASKFFWTSDVGKDVV